MTPARTPRRARWAAALLAVAAALLPGPTASAAVAADTGPAGIDVAGNAGCSGTAVSFDADGDQLGFVSTGSGVGASQDAPLAVSSDGTVTFAARSGSAITDSSWTLRVGGVPVKSGASSNAEAKKVVLGSAELADYLPVPVTGLMLVDVEITGDRSLGCTASAWVTLDGNGWTSGNGLLGIGLLVLGLIGLGFSRPVPAHGSPGGVRSHGAKGAVFGALTGLGLTVLLVSLSVIPFGSVWLPLAVVGAGFVVGLLFGKVMPARGGPAA